MSELALPDGWSSLTWEQVTLDKTGFKRGPFGGSLKKEYFVDIGYAVYEQYAPINDDCTRFRYFVDEAKYQEMSGFSVVSGDFLISCSGTMGKITQVPKTAPAGIINQALLRIRLNENLIDPSYFLHLFRSSDVQERILKKSAGGAIQNLAAVKELKKTVMPIPAIAEQKEIVKFLDIHLSTVSQIQARLDAIPKLIEKFRQSVLNDAVSGNLTEDSINFDSMILGDLIYLQYGKALPAKNRSGDGYPVYGSNGEVGRHQKYCTEGPFIIVGRKGSFGEITWSSESGWAIDTAYFVELRKQDDLKFIYYLLQTLELNTLNRSTAIPGLNRNDAYSQPVQIPDIEAQKRIVKLIESYFTYIELIEKSVATAKARVDHLTQSILHQAFTGNLTAEWREQNPELITGDNSAEALLAKIKAEKKKASKA